VLHPQDPAASIENQPNESNSEPPLFSYKIRFHMTIPRMCLPSSVFPAGLEPILCMRVTYMPYMLHVPLISSSLICPSS